VKVLGVCIDSFRAEIDGKVAKQVGRHEAKQGYAGGGHEQFAPYGTTNHVVQRHGADIPLDAGSME
jgi:hypothetical protein